MVKKVLLLGKSGQVGFELNRSLSSLGELYTPTRKEVDLEDELQISSLLKDVKPDIIVNAAAWTDVDGAEIYKEKAYAINYRLPKLLSDYANKHKIWLIHYSTDYVYSGFGSKPWKEGDPAHPQTYYGYTKLEGDKAVQEICDKFIIFRTSWVYGARFNNFMTTMLRLGLEKKSIKVVSDQFGAPTTSRLIADITLLAIQGNNGQPIIDPGVYHLTSRGITNWHEFACKIFKLAKKFNLKLKLSPNNIDEIKSEEWITAATRPLNSRLSIELIEYSLGIVLPNWESQLELVFNELQI